MFLSGGASSLSAPTDDCRDNCLESCLDICLDNCLFISEREVPRERGGRTKEEESLDLDKITANNNHCRQLSNKVNDLQQQNREF